MRLAFALLLTGFAMPLLALSAAQVRLFSRSLSYFEAPASESAIAIAWRRLFTLPPLPPRPELSSPCLNSCITRPSISR